ncbi:MAG: CapA family protein, partial [Candidatus Cryptobacteroides sp.]|nr:CapA family protein [Candidatus Cryptobacteroides sp.]
MKNHFPTYCLPAVITILVFAATISASAKAAADSSLFTLHSSLKDTLHSSLHKDTVEVLFTGDILLDRGVRQRIEHIGIERLFSKGIESLFRQADYVVGNLECPATKTIQPNFKKFVFRAEPEWLSTLREHHVTHLNLANNHSIDQGRAGLVDTWQNIRKA